MKATAPETTAQHVKAIGMRIGLERKALKVFVEEATDFADGLQSLESADWRIGNSRVLKMWEEEVAQSALQEGVLNFV